MPIDWYEYYRQNIISVNEFVDRHIYSTCTDIVELLINCPDGADDIYHEDDWFVVYKEEVDDEGLVVTVNQCEVMQHWFVSDWMAKELQKKGERILYIGKHPVWLRTSWGVSLAQEFNILEIHKENDEVWKL